LVANPIRSYSGSRQVRKRLPPPCIDVLTLFPKLFGRQGPKIERAVDCLHGLYSHFERHERRVATTIGVSGDWSITAASPSNRLYELPFL
jgi:hypothetical protein